MAKYTWSEVFMSCEGEGPYTGWPTLYIRYTGCNFQCRGFNNPEGLDTTSIEVLGFDPKDYNNLKNIPLITKGCDSIYSWDQKFSHMWKSDDENVLTELVMNTIPYGQWNHPITGHPTILSITGGEPLVKWKNIPILLNHNNFEDLEIVLFETNCSVPINDNFITDLNNWITSGYNRKVVWSNSPKLSVSGEEWNRAIRPDVAIKQTYVKSYEQYFKFVCGPNDRDFDEVSNAMRQYHSIGISHKTPVYIMPVACQQSDQTNITAQVAKMCIERGYIYCHRTHLEIFGNGVGT